MIRGGGAVNHGRARVLPLESFAELAFELRLVARDKAHAAESGEQLVAQIEALGEIGTRRPLELPGMRDAVAELQHRARLAGRAAELLGALAPHEEEVRTLFAVNEQQPAAVVPQRRGRQWRSIDWKSWFPAVRRTCRRAFRST